jgi:hypothetical protein
VRKNSFVKSQSKYYPNPTASAHTQQHIGIKMVMRCPFKNNSFGGHVNERDIHSLPAVQMYFPSKDKQWRDQFSFPPEVSKNVRFSSVTQQVEMYKDKSGRSAI